MTCKDVKDIVEEYGSVSELVKKICTDRACTLDAIQKSLKTQNIEMTEYVIAAIIAQIKEMMVFEKSHTFDVGNAITYHKCWFGIVDIGEEIGNTVVTVEYKDFYLYNMDRYEDKAFRRHILSKLEFEELGRTVINDDDKLRDALESLNIDKEKWVNYALIDDRGDVYCVKWQESRGYSTTRYLGKLISSK